MRFVGGEGLLAGEFAVDDDVNVITDLVELLVFRDGERPVALYGF